MNAPLPPDALAAAPGVQRLVWDSRYGRMLIEIEGGLIRVNGRVVEPAEAAAGHVAAPALNPPALRTPRS